MARPSGSIFLMPNIQYRKRRRLREQPQATNRSKRARLRRRAISRQYAKWEGTFVPSQIPKGRNGKPHWREFRIILRDLQHQMLHVALTQEHRAHIHDCEVGARLTFSEWLDEQLRPLGARRVWDITVDAEGIHADSYEALVTIKLRWNEVEE